MNNNVVYCSACGVEYNTKRAQLGYETCLECGEARAFKVAEFRSKCSAPAFNKGAYQPMMTLDDARWAGR